MGGRRRGIVAVAVAFALVSGAGCGDSRSDPRASTSAKRVATGPPQWLLAQRHAPILHLHRDESFLPLSGKHFVTESRLMFADDDGCPDRFIVKGRRELPRLTEQPLYSSAPYADSGCRRTGSRYDTAEVTRPHDDSPERSAGLNAGEGFYLDLDDRLRRGAAVSRQSGRAEIHGAATWYEVHGRRITYWLLFGMSSPRAPDGSRVRATTHEGDWERIDVLLSDSSGRSVPRALRLFDPDAAARDIPWSQLRTRRAVHAHEDPPSPSHPILFAALGSHTLYPRPGTRLRLADLGGSRSARVRDMGVGPCRACPRWETSLPLFPLESQYWYGFGGAWGDVGATSATTGPLGPRR